MFCLSLALFFPDNFQEEWEREESYFSQLEKKEELEKKMQSIMQLKVSVVQCTKVREGGREGEGRKKGRKGRRDRVREEILRE